MISMRGRHRIDVGSAYDRRKIRRRFSRQRCKGAAEDREAGGDRERNLAIGKRVWRSGKEFCDRKRNQARCWQDAVRADEKKDRASRWPNVVGADGCWKGRERRGGEWQALYLGETPRKRRKGYREEGCHD